MPWLKHGIWGMITPSLFRDSLYNGYVLSHTASFMENNFDSQWLCERCYPKQKSSFFGKELYSGIAYRTMIRCRLIQSGKLSSLQVRTAMDTMTELKNEGTIQQVKVESEL